jgi:tetratricopeptide (TPR) repeat protein
MHYNLAVILTEKGEYAAAIREYEKVIESRPEDADAHYNLGILYDDHLKDSINALEHYRQYIRLAPASTEAPRVREWIHQKEFDEAFRDKTMRRNP